MGTLKARDHAGRRLEPVSSADMKHRGIEAEVGVILPHAVQNYRDAPGQRNPSRRLLANDCRAVHRALGTATTRKLRRPGPQPCRPPTMHHDGGRLAQRTAQVDVTCLGDPA